MFKLVLAFAFVGFCMAKPASEEVVPIVSEEIVVENDGKFHYSYESGDGTKAQESGELKKLDEGEGEVVQGDFSYTAPDGQKYVVTYVADENGYQPVGEHIPAIPEAIARSIEWNKAHPEEEEEEAKKL